MTPDRLFASTLHISFIRNKSNSNNYTLHILRFCWHLGVDLAAMDPTPRVQFALEDSCCFKDLPDLTQQSFTLRDTQMVGWLENLHGQGISQLGLRTLEDTLVSQRRATVFLTEFRTKLLQLSEGFLLQRGVLS